MSLCVCMSALGFFDPVVCCINVFCYSLWEMRNFRGLFHVTWFSSMSTFRFLFCEISLCHQRCYFDYLGLYTKYYINIVNSFFFLIDRDATLAHKAEALELQRQLRRLQTQYDLLTGQSSSLIQGRRARVAATSAVTGQITSIEDSLSARNLQVWYMPSYNCLRDLQLFWSLIILWCVLSVFSCDLDEWSSRKIGFHFSRAGALSFRRR